MNHDKLSPKSPERSASIEELSLLRERIGTFVETHGPAVTFPDGTHIVDTGKEPPRPLTAEEHIPTIYLTFPAAFLSEIAPGPTRRLQIKEMALLRDIPTYEYTGEGPIPPGPQEVDMGDIHDRYWSSGGGTGVYIGKSSDAVFDSTFYKLSAANDFSRASEPREGDPWPLPSQDPSYISEQECEDLNAILDALMQLDPNTLSSVMQSETS